jgi:hypothetical protein
MPWVNLGKFHIRALNGLISTLIDFGGFTSNHPATALVRAWALVFYRYITGNAGV